MPTLCDAGPLVAMIDYNDEDHRECIGIFGSLPLPLITTWPAFTEASYLLFRSGGWIYQDKLWKSVEADTLVILHISQGEQIRMRRLMEKYRDTPMDLADASLVAAEALGLRRIFTLDSHFNAYRTADGGAFEIVP